MKMESMTVYVVPWVQQEEIEIGCPDWLETNEGGYVESMEGRGERVRDDKHKDEDEEKDDCGEEGEEREEREGRWKLSIILICNVLMYNPDMDVCIYNTINHKPLPR